MTTVVASSIPCSSASVMTHQVVAPLTLTRKSLLESSPTESHTYFESGLLWFCGEPTLNMLGAGRKHALSPEDADAVSMLVEFSDADGRALETALEAIRVANHDLQPDVTPRMETGAEMQTLLHACGFAHPHQAFRLPVSAPVDCLLTARVRPGRLPSDCPCPPRSTAFS